MSYYFSHDWFAKHIPNFNKLLPFANQELHILEIGSFEGRSTTWFIDNLLNHPKSTITSVDPFLESDKTTVVEKTTLEKFLNNISQSKYPEKLIKYIDKSDLILPKLITDHKKYSLIYVDGSHLAIDVLFDALLSWKLLENGGLLWFDDFLGGDEETIINKPWLLPNAGIESFIQCLDPNTYEILLKEYQLVIRKKSDN